MINTINQYKNLLTFLPFIICLLIFSSCGKERKEKEEMNLQELKQSTVAYLKKKKYDQATDMLQQIIAKYPENEEISKYKLLLADTYFKNGEHQVSQKMYEHFHQYYPSDKKAEYAKYH